MMKFGHLISSISIFRALVVGVFMLLEFNSYATHLMGGEITARQIAPDQYEVNMVLYRDDQGISMSTSQSYHVFDQFGSKVGTYNFGYISQPSGQQVPNFPYGVQPYYFQDEITLSSAGKYTIVFDHCCRNGAILNLSDPLNETMYLKTELTVFNNAHNSTPEFLAMPIAYLPINFPWQYNPVPYDADGDSLYWYIDGVETAYTDPPNSSSYQSYGWQLPFGTVTNPFSINHHTGMISWTANMIGNFVASIVIEEYRNGLKIGETRRDMQFVVVPNNGNSVPDIDIVDDEGQPLPLMPHGGYEITLVVDQPLDLTILGEDYDININELTLDCMGGPLQNDADFSITQVNDNQSIQANLTWTPNKSDIGKLHIINFRIGDGLWSYDKTVLVNVKESLSWDEMELDLFPNPNSGLFIIALNDNHESFNHLYILDGLGKVVYQQELYWNQRENTTIETNLPKGMYFCILADNEGNKITSKVIIQ